MLSQRFLMPLAFVGAVVASNGAVAQTASSHEQAMLAALNPTLRAEVQTRASAPGQNVSEVIDTILLNKISMLVAQGKIVATDHVKKIVVVELPNNQWRVFKFNPQTLEVAA